MFLRRHRRPFRLFLHRQFRPIRLRMPEDCELSPADFDLMDGMIEFYWPEEPEEAPEVKLELVKDGEDNGENA